MGVLLTWENPPADSNWENTEIHRATSEEGVYSLVDSVEISDTSFYDCAGDTGSWYKIRFTATSGTCTESEFSDAIQGDVRFLYANPTDVARVGGLNIDNLPKDLTVNDLYRWIGDVSRSIDNVNENVYGRTDTFEYIGSSLYLDVGKTVKIPHRNIATGEVVQFKNSVTEDTFSTLTQGFDYQVKRDIGRFYLYTFPSVQPRRIEDIKITGTYGQTDIPDEIRQLCEVVSAIRIFVHLTGGSFDDVTSYQLGEYSESLGEPFTNLREAVKMLEVEKVRLMKATGTTIKKSRMRLA